MTKHPAYLKENALIAITCPSGFLTREKADSAAKQLLAWGFRVIIGNTVGAAHHYFSGTDQERLADLQQFLDDPDVDAILMGRGGYGMSRIIDDIDFTAFVQKPKWICGFSDITVLHSHIHHNYNIATLHSIMCGAFLPETIYSPQVQSFKNALSGAGIAYSFEGSPRNRNGIAEGILVGGNLAMLAHLSGSNSELQTDGKILFIEDVGEYLYNIDRMLYNLKRSGKLSNLKALILGGFTDLQDTERPFGQDIYQIINSKVAEFDFPVCFNFPCGHQDHNLSIILGGNYQLTVGTEKSVLTMIS